MSSDLFPLQWPERVPSCAQVTEQPAAPGWTWALRGQKLLRPYYCNTIVTSGQLPPFTSVLSEVFSEWELQIHWLLRSLCSSYTTNNNKAMQLFWVEQQGAVKAAEEWREKGWKGTRCSPLTGTGYWSLFSVFHPFPSAAATYTQLQSLDLISWWTAALGTRAGWLHLAEQGEESFTAQPHANWHLWDPSPLWAFAVWLKFIWVW